MAACDVWFGGVGGGGAVGDGVGGGDLEEIEELEE